MTIVVTLLHHDFPVKPSILALGHSQSAATRRLLPVVEFLSGIAQGPGSA